jgi:predicted O-methyltransferase YrrM
LETEQLPADPVVRNLLAIIAAELVGDGAPDAAAAAPPTIGLARTFLRQAHPTLHLVGIDIFEPALDLARANVEGAGLADRTELRLQDAAPAPVRLYAGLRR